MSKVSINWGLLFILGLASIFGYTLLLHAESTERQAIEYEQRVKNYNAEMIRNGCHVSYLIAAGDQIYPVWLCPDGNVYKGYAE